VSTLTVRTATLYDLERVVECDPSAAVDDDRRAFLTAAIVAGECRVAVEADTIVGFAVTTPRRFFDRAFLELLMVAPSTRRHGVGRALLRDAVQSADGPGVWTSTNRSNAPMQGLLASEGWTFSGELVGLDDGDPELFFRTDLVHRDP